MCLIKYNFLTHVQSAVADLFPGGTPVLRYLFARNADGNVEILGAESRAPEYYEASITFPKSLSDHLTADKAGLVLSYYESGNLFPLGNYTDMGMYVTPVVAASFANQVIDSLKDDVLITLRLNVTSKANVTCVSWDFEANGKQTNKQTEKLTNRQ